jgi:hypothetical protein
MAQLYEAQEKMRDPICGPLAAAANLPWRQAPRPEIKSDMALPLQ